VAAVLALVAVAAAVLIAVVPRTGAARARVCGVDASSCLALQQDAAGTWGLLPLRGGRLEVRNRGLTGSVDVGVVGYLGSDPLRLLPTTATSGSATVGREETAGLRLAGMPDGAQLVLVRSDGTGREASACSGSSCGPLHVGVRPVVAAPTAAVISRLLDARPGITSVEARRAGGTVADELEARAAAPARLTAALRPGRGRLTVDWLLAAGGEHVSAVRVAVRARNGAGPRQVHDAIAASGSLVLADLDPSTRYVVDVAPVVSSGGKQVAAAAVQLSAVPDGARAAAGATSPSVPTGWTPLIRQDFRRAAPLGTFADRYPGWSWYDGMTETSRETKRPRGQVGVWNSKTTMSVHDGLLDCRLHTAGARPQVCALTPTPTGRIWHGQRYGRYSVRFKSDPVPGYKIAWLLWPDSNDWNQGEIDFPEASLNGAITGSSHRNDGDPADFAWFVQTATRMDGWHTATIDWQPGRLTYLLDGESWTTTDPAALPRVPMRWTLQAETEIEDAAPARSAQGHILIDWVAAWSRAGR
jgi:hypothetical protein